MANINVLSKTTPRPINGGQQGAFEQCFTCSWTTGSTTGTVPVGMKKVLRIKGFVVMNASAIANDLVAFAGTVNGDGSLLLDTGDTISLMRPAGTTSGCKFSFVIEGYP